MDQELFQITERERFKALRNIRIELMEKIAFFFLQMGNKLFNSDLVRVGLWRVLPESCYFEPVPKMMNSLIEKLNH